MHGDPLGGRIPLHLSYRHLEIDDKFNVHVLNIEEDALYILV